MRDLKVPNICCYASRPSKDFPSNGGRKSLRSLAMAWRSSITEGAEDTGCERPAWRIAIGVHRTAITSSWDSSVSMLTSSIPLRRPAMPSAHISSTEAPDGWLLASFPYACSTNIFSDGVSSSVTIVTADKGIASSMIRVGFSFLLTVSSDSTVETWISPLTGAGGPVSRTLAYLLRADINSSLFTR